MVVPRTATRAATKPIEELGRSRYSFRSVRISRWYSNQARNSDKSPREIMVSPNSLGPRIEDLGGAFAVRPSRGSNWKNLYAEKPKAINEVDVRIAAMIVRS